MRALRRYLKGGEITLTPERFEGRETYVARAEFLPLEIRLRPSA